MDYVFFWLKKLVLSKITIPPQMGGSPSCIQKENTIGIGETMFVLYTKSAPRGEKTKI